MTSVSVLVCCPNPACPARLVEGAQVDREQWDATWHEAQRYGDNPRPGEWDSNISCPQCSEEGIDPESGQLDSAEEELGERCEEHGIVWCPQCPTTEGEMVYRQAERARSANHGISKDALLYWKASA